MKNYETLEKTFDERLRPAFIGFTDDAMQQLKRSFIANELDDYCEWYAAHLDALADVLNEYNAEYLRATYFELIEDGETPKEAFETVVCCALERDL